MLKYISASLALLLYCFVVSIAISTMKGFAKSEADRRQTFICMTIEKKNSINQKKNAKSACANLSLAFLF